MIVAGPAHTTDAFSECHLLQRKDANEFSDGFADIYDDLTAHLAYPSWVDYVEDLAAEAGAQSQTILDLGCGTGSFALEALCRGKEVIGVDASTAMLERCEAKLAHHATGGHWHAVHTLFQGMVLDEVADIAVCFFDGLNYLLNDESFRRTLQRVHRAIRPGGLFVFDLVSRAAYRRNIFQHGGTLRRTGLLPPRHYRTVGEFCQRHAVYALDLIVSESASGEEQAVYGFYQRYFDAADVIGWLDAARFLDVRCLGAFSLEPPGADADRWTFVARKP